MSQDKQNSHMKDISQIMQVFEDIISEQRQEIERLEKAIRILIMQLKAAKPASMMFSKKD